MGDDVVHPYDPEEEITKQCKYTEEAYDQYITMQVMLTMDDGYRKAKFFGRKRDTGGKSVGSEKINPLLDSRVYTVHFDDGTLHQYAENIIANNMYAKVDDEGGEHILMIDITEYQSNISAVKQEGV